MRGLPLLLAVLLLAIPPPSTADPGSLAAFLSFTPTGPAAVGSSVTVTLEVYAAGARVPTTAAMLTAAGVPVPLVLRAPGLLEATYTVRAPDLDTDGTILFRADVSANRERVNVTGRLRTAVETVRGDLQVGIRFEDPADRTPVPGDAITFTAQVLWRGNQLDPDTFADFVVLYETSEGFGAPIPVPVVRVSLGLYDGTYGVDPTLAEGVRLHIRASVTRAQISALAEEVVEVAFAEIWARDLAIDSGSFRLTLCAADLGGRPIPGAIVHITKPSTAVAVADAEGLARVDIPLGNASAVTLEGILTAEGRQQALGAVLPSIPRTGPVSSGPRLVWSGDAERVEPEDQVVGRYRVFNGTAAWAQRFVHYYGAWEDLSGVRGRVLFWGNGTTDSTGNLTFSFRAPTTEGIVRFTAFLPLGPDNRTNDGVWYARARAAIPVLFALRPEASDPAVSLQAGALRRAQESTVHISTTVLGALDVSLVWSVHDPTWFRVGPVLRRHLPREGGAFRGSVQLPGCLPAGLPIALEATVEVLGTGEVHNTTLLTTVEGPTRPPGITSATLAAVGGLAVATVSVLAVLLLRRRSSRGRDRLM